MQRILLLGCLITSTVSAQVDTAQSSDGHNAHSIPFASSGNTLELTLASAGTRSEDAMMVRLVEAPDWVSVYPDATNAEVVQNTSDATATFLFDLLSSAPVGESGTLEFEVASPDGEVVGSHVLRLVAEAPEQFRLISAYPNPFRTASRVAYELPEAAQVGFSVYDVLGRRVFEERSDQEAGRREQHIEGNSLAPGLYVWQLVVDSAKGRTVEHGRLTLAR